MVLFVFSILLTHRPDDKTSLLTSHKRIIGISCSVIGAVMLLAALFTMPVAQDITLTDALSRSDVNMEQIGTALLGTGKFQYLLPFEAVSVLLLACIIGGIVVARKK